jgi:hypothetical protein
LDLGLEPERDNGGREAELGSREQGGRYALASPPGAEEVDGDTRPTPRMTA